MNARRGVVFGIAGVVTLGGLLGALWLGAWAFDVRRFTTHRTRLERLQARRPTNAQLVEAFRAENTLLLGRSETPAALADFATWFAGRRASEIEASGRPFAATEVYLAGDVVYFIHYDAAAIMRGFAIVDARERRAGRSESPR